MQSTAGGGPSPSPRPGSAGAPATTAGEKPSAANAASAFVCVECRRPFTVDCSAWLRIKPPLPPDDFTVEANEVRAHRLLDAPPPTVFFSAGNDNLGGAAPAVVFGTRLSAPPAAEEHDWVKLTPDQCLAHCHMLGDLTGRDVPLCAPCWAQRLKEMQTEIDRIRTATEHVVATARSFGDESTARRSGALALPSADADAIARDGFDPTDDERAAYDAAVAELRALESEEADLDAQLADLAAQEDSIAGVVNDRLASQWLAQEDTIRAEGDNRRLLAEISRLETLVALECLFPLDTDATVPTVCGLRLGKLPSSQAAPGEINAASGLLLVAVEILRSRHEAEVKCPTVKQLLLNADASQIEIRKSATAKVERMDFFIKTSFFSWRTYGPAWVALIDLLRAIVTALKAKLTAVQSDSSRSDADLRHASAVLKNANALPEISGDTVGGFSVRYGDVPDATWTNATRESLKVVRWAFQADDCVMHGRPEARPAADAASATASPQSPVAPQSDGTYGEQ